MRLPFVSFLFPALVLGLLAGCGGDDGAGPSAGTGDTTAPTVVRFSPPADAYGVGGGAPIVLEFSEAMDPSGAAAAIRISTDDSLSLTWRDDRTLVVDHGWIREGSWVRVTAGTGFRDLAGNALAAELEWGYGVYTNSFLAVASEPVEGTEALARNARIRIRFTRPPDVANLSSRIRVETGEGATSEQVSFWIAERGDVEVEIRPRLDETWPADAPLTITVRSGAPALSGESTSSDRVFSFRTASDVDLRAPVVMDFSPAPGDELDPRTRAIQIAFSEPIDTSTFQPQVLGAQLGIVLAIDGLQPYWSADRTVWTVPLPDVLPDELPVLITLDGFRDLAGNASNARVEYRATFAGEAELMPFVDGVGSSFAMNGSREGGGSVSVFSDSERYVVESQSDGSHRVVRIDTFDGETPLGYEQFRRTETALTQEAVLRPDSGPVLPTRFEPGLDIVRFPLEIGSQNATTTIVEGANVGAVDLRITVLGRADLARAGSFGVFVGNTYVPLATNPVWADVWKTVLDYEVVVEDVLVMAVSDTSWFAPGVGRIRRATVETDFAGGTETKETRVLEDLIYRD